MIEVLPMGYSTLSFTWKILIRLKGSHTSVEPTGWGVVGIEAWPSRLTWPLCLAQTLAHLSAFVNGVKEVLWCRGHSLSVKKKHVWLDWWHVCHSVQTADTQGHYWGGRSPTWLVWSATISNGVVGPSGSGARKTNQDSAVPQLSR